VLTQRLFVRLPEDRIQGPESGAPGHTLRSFAVDRRLQGVVAHILSYRESIATGHEIVEHVLPDGALRLIVQLDGDGPQLTVLGPTAGPARVCLRGVMQGLSLTLQPGAATVLLGVPAGELAGLALPLHALLRDEAPRLVEQMALARDDATRVARLQQLLRRRWLQQRPAANDAPAQAARALALLQASPGRQPVRAVAAAVGVGERRLQQIFHEQVGLTPRVVGRLARLHRTLRALRQGSAASWAELALDHGYYDQAHLANEFRALCGMTPTEFVGRGAVALSSKTAA
jgi:AraC-like DNA-binding protein